MKKQYLGLMVLMMFMAVVTYAKTKKATPAKSAYTYIKMTRTPCFGRCPYYSIEIYSTGLVRYTGMSFATPQGTYEKNLGKAVAEKIFKEAAEVRLDTCRAQYDMLVSDLPGIMYSYTYKGKTKKIGNANFGPEFLKQLANDIDAATRPADSWKKTADYKEKN